MERIVLVKLNGPAERKVCLSVASEKSVSSCHPMLGDWDLVVVLEGTEAEVATAVRALKSNPDVARAEVNERVRFHFTKMKGLEDKGPDLKRSIDGAPIIICPRCGNETFAYTAGCTTVAVPGCQDPGAVHYSCAVCGHTMLFTRR